MNDNILNVIALRNITKEDVESMCHVVEMTFGGGKDLKNLFVTNIKIKKMTVQRKNVLMNEKRTIKL
jgi:hypothetical protein